MYDNNRDKVWGLLLYIDPLSSCKSYPRPAGLSLPLSGQVVVDSSGWRGGGGAGGGGGLEGGGWSVDIPDTSHHFWSCFIILIFLFF